ncbi:MAG: Far upstream element-binding protein 3 [Marteilia pararefringens]
MNVPINLCGLIIGKQGETIKKLQAETGVKIELIQDSAEKNTAFKPLRFTGYQEKVQSAIETVKTYLINHGDIKLMSSILSSEPGLITEHIRVPKLAVGAVIGRSGETIRDIALLSGAKVQFDKEELMQPQDSRNGGDKTCIIVGTHEAVEAAKLKVIDIINQSVRLNQPSAVPTVGKEIQTEFPIPFDKIGMVIGKSGSTIREINAITGAHAKISEDPPDDNNQKKFTIQGGTENVKKCIILMCEKAGIPSPMDGYNMVMSNPLMALAAMTNAGVPNAMAAYSGTPTAAPYVPNPSFTPYINNFDPSSGNLPALGQQPEVNNAFQQNLSAPNPNLTPQLFNYGGSNSTSDNSNNAHLASNATATASPGTQAQVMSGQEEIKKDYTLEWVAHLRMLGQFEQADALLKQYQGTSSDNAGVDAQNSPKI